MLVGHDHRSQGIEGRGPRSEVKVMHQANAVGPTLMEGSFSSIVVCLSLMWYNRVIALLIYCTLLMYWSNIV